MRTDIFRKTWLLQWGIALLTLGGYSVAQAQQYVEDYARAATSSQPSAMEAFEPSANSQQDVYHLVSGQAPSASVLANQIQAAPTAAAPAPTAAAPASSTPVAIAPVTAAPAANPAMDDVSRQQLAQMQAVQAQQMAQAQAQQMAPACRNIVSTDIAGATDGLLLRNLNTMTGGKNGGFFLNGFIDQSAYYGSNSKSRYYTPSGEKEGYQMNQLYLTAGKNVNQTGGFSLGFRADVMYGTDYYNLQTMGLETRRDNSARWNKTDGDPAYRNGFNEYGIALPQAYVDMYLPVLRGTVLRVGHFYSVLGYESNMASQNFFKSQTYSRRYGMPETMSGVMSYTRLGYGWSMILGGVNAWNALDCVDNQASFVGGLKYEDQGFTFGANVMTGKQCVAGNQPLTAVEGSAWATVLNTYAKMALTQRWTYVIEFTGAYDDSDYRCYEQWTKTRNCRKTGRSWLGLTNRLLYQMTDTVAIGTRFEWFRDFDCSVIDGGYGYTYNSGNADYLALTFGANWTPFSWLNIRPEVRCDWSSYRAFDDNNSRTFDNFTKEYQVTYGLDAVVKF